MSTIHRMIASSLVVVAVVVSTAGKANAQAGGRGPARPAGRGVVKSLDVATGMITVQLSLNQKQAVSLQVEGPNISGVVKKSADPGRNSLTVSFGGTV